MCIVCVLLILMCCRVIRCSCLVLPSVGDCGFLAPHSFPLPTTCLLHTILPTFVLPSTTVHCALPRLHSTLPARSRSFAACILRPKTFYRWAIPSFAFAFLPGVSAAATFHLFYRVPLPRRTLRTFAPGGEGEEGGGKEHLTHSLGACPFPWHLPSYTAGLLLLSPASSPSTSPLWEAPWDILDSYTATTIPPVWVLLYLPSPSSLSPSASTSPLLACLTLSLLTPPPALLLLSATAATPIPTISFRLPHTAERAAVSRSSLRCCTLMPPLRFSRLRLTRTFAATHAACGICEPLPGRAAMVADNIGRSGAWRTIHNAFAAFLLPHSPFYILDRDRLVTWWVQNGARINMDRE